MPRASEPTSALLRSTFALILISFRRTSAGRFFPAGTPAPESPNTPLPLLGSAEQGPYNLQQTQPPCPQSTRCRGPTAPLSRRTKPAAPARLVAQRWLRLQCRLGRARHPCGLFPVFLHRADSSLPPL